jgi:hypothetical protein
LLKIKSTLLNNNAATGNEVHLEHAPMYLIDLYCLVTIDRCQ